MGLAGRKEKQRIPNDPRNLSWADGEFSFVLHPTHPDLVNFSDANKFGAAYLQKLGWSAGSGLGASGEGRTTHIKVQQKLDMFGIGAAHQKDPNGIAWKQNKDFENLLKRLNGTNGDGEEEEGISKIDGFARAREVQEAEDVEKIVDVTEEEGSKKKRKRDADDSKDGQKKSKKAKDGDGSKKEKKKFKGSSGKRSKEGESAEKRTEEDIVGGPSSPSETIQPTQFVARP